MFVVVVRFEFSRVFFHFDRWLSRAPVFVASPGDLRRQEPTTLVEVTDGFAGFSIGAAHVMFSFVCPSVSASLRGRRAL